MLAFISSMEEETVVTAVVWPALPSAMRWETSAMSRETPSRLLKAARTCSTIARRFPLIC